MGMKKTVIIVYVIVLLLFMSGCAFSSQDVNLYGVKITKVQASLSYAYFLDNDGVLYSTGADTDASAYVVFKDKKKGIVAENVRDFGTMMCGGYYIDNSDNLYLWNRDDVPLYNYKKGSAKCVLTDVREVVFSKYHMLYIDTKSDLYIAGEFGGESYIINEPKFLESNVLSAGTDGSTVMWCQSNGMIGCVGASLFDTDLLNKHFGLKPIQNIVVNNHYILLLSNGELWFYGDYENFKYRKNVSDDAKNLKLLATGVTEAVGAYSSIIALDSDGNVKLWGRCLYDWDVEKDEAQYEYVDDYSLAENGKSVYVSDGCICYVDDQYNSRIYHDGGWRSFYGNSTRDRYIGIKREPITWISS